MTTLNQEFRRYLRILCFAALLSPLSLYAYEGPLIDGHLHLSAASDPTLIEERFRSQKIIGAVIFPREFNAGNDPGITDDGVRRFMEKAPGLGWVLLGLQLKALHKKNAAKYWLHPPEAWREWLSFAEGELISGRRKGMGELIVRHYDYHGRGGDEVDYPIQSKVFKDLMGLSERTGRPLVIHAEGEAHAAAPIRSWYSSG